jgi:protein-S-isoprenylcysteine O-methyltransferase Ste14
MILVYKLVGFILATIGIIWVSRASLRDIRHHGFYRFFSWEIVLILFLMNVDDWFVDPFSLRQILSWSFLVISLVLISQGIWLFRKKGNIDSDRRDPALVGVEKTTKLVTTGVYHYIRHPFYSSLLSLGWGVLLKNPSWIGVLLALANTACLTVTAKIEEGENIQYFGDIYQAYMKQTKMFIPFIF